MRLLFIFRFIICLLFQQNIQHFIYAYQRIFLSELLKLPDGVWQFEMSHHGGMLSTFDNLFETPMQLLPRTGDYTVVLDSDMQPRCITRTTKVEVVPFEDVTADCAAAEGDGTLAAWKKAHRKTFAAACEEIGIDFDERMKCVCEYFDVVYRAVGQ